MTVFDLQENIELPDNCLPQGVETALTIGNFDGFHRGHQALIDACMENCRDRKNRFPAVFTFATHPRLLSDPSFELLASPAETVARFRAAGVRYLFRTEYPSVCGMSPETFFSDYLFGQMHARFFVIGENFRFGKSAAGDCNTLSALAAEHGIACCVQPLLHDGGEVVSSSAVRQALADGDCEQAIRLLGRPYGLRGTVEGGFGVGHKIGFPTANLTPPAQRVIPADGVYITRVVYAGAHLPAVTDIGTRPTVHPDGEHVIETFLLDRHVNLYEQEITVCFLRRMRGEIPFASLDALQAQIASDVDTAHRYFQDHPTEQV